MAAIFWPSAHFNGHQTDLKYENQWKYAMLGINLEDLAPLIDMGYCQSAPALCDLKLKHFFHDHIFRILEDILN